MARATHGPGIGRSVAAVVAAVLVSVLAASVAHAAGGAVFQPLELSAQLRQVVLLVALGGLAFSLRSL